MQRILVPSDLSPSSNSVLPYALTLGQTFDSKVYLVHVMDPADIGQPEKLEAFPRVSNFFEQDRTRADLPPLRSSIPIGKIYQYDRHPQRVILRFARKKQVDLICLASTQDSSRMAWWSAGKTVESIIRHASCSVLCMRGRPLPIKDWTRPQFHNVLLLLDLHDPQSAALDHALALTRIYGSMLHVYPLSNKPDWHDSELIERVAQLETDQTNVLLFANPQRRLKNLLAFTGQTSLDLIVMPATVRTRLSLPFIRDVLVELMRSSEAPIFLLR